MNIKTTEEHFQSLGSLEVERQIPGLVPATHREVLYVEDRNEEPFEVLFRRLVRHVNPPVMKDGGTLIEGCVLTLPTGRRFRALSYRGDIEGWRQQILQGAVALDVRVGQLVEGELVLDDGTSYTLADCQVEFD